MSKLEELKKLRDELNITVKGLDRYPKGETNVIVANHSCLMDIFALPSVIPEDTVSLISSRVLYKNNIERQEMVNKYLYSMPIEAHGGSIYSSMCIRYASEILTNGISVNIFPEGAYVIDDCIYKGRTGASRILYAGKAFRLNPNLVPVAINIKNKDLEMNMDNYIPNKDYEIEITILDPIEYSEYFYSYLNSFDNDIRNSLLHAPIDDAMKSIANILNKEYLDWYIPLKDKGNVIFSDGRVVVRHKAQNNFLYKQYESDLSERANTLVKKLK